MFSIFLLQHLIYINHLFLDRQRGAIRSVLLVIIGWQSSFLRNGSKDFSDFLQEGKKFTELDF